MIERLLIKDSLTFKEAIIAPNKGFNVFSGASGSGKSVLMESILALFGLKEANAQLIEAEINPSYLSLDDCGVLDDEECTISIIKKDKTKYFINHQAFSKKKVKDLFGECIKYISTHSVKELSHTNLLRILDTSIKEEEFKILLDSYQKNYASFVAKNAQMEQILAQEKNIIELREFALFEITQIESINPKIGEYDELMRIKKDLSKKEKQLEKIASLKVAVEKFNQILDFLDSIDKNKEEFDEVFGEIENIFREEEEYLENISEDDIESILNRLEMLSKFVHKYGSIENTIEYLENKKKELESYNNLSFNKETLQKELDILKQDIEYQAQKIRQWRKDKLLDFTKHLEIYSQKLMLPSPIINLLKVDLGESGGDLLEILLEDSSVETLSSGEFNRLKLAILCLEIEFSKQNGVIILDEIDANLSGSESEGVAQVLSMLSRDYQIFAISHQSHMPCFAKHHYLIQKNANGSQITLLNKEGRVQEIARIISGANITNEALLFAREKLQDL